MFNQYPYLNLNDLNLDYILKAIKEMRYEVTNFVSINAIKYADPIQWNITTQYEKNTIVIDPVTGTAYISVAPVPAGVALTRPEYWTVVFDLGSFVTRAAQNFTSRWESDTTLTATFPTNTGEWLVWGDVLYKALSNIIAGDTYVVGSNIEHFTIEDLYNAYLNTIASILAMVGDLADLTTSDTTSIVNAINSVVSDLSNVASDLAQEVIDRSNADTALDNKIKIFEDSEPINVLTLGVDNTGAVDCADIVNTALVDTALYFPIGVYKISKPISALHNIYGAGNANGASEPSANYPSRTVFLADSSFVGNAMIECNSNRPVKLRDFDLSIYGNEHGIDIAPTTERTFNQIEKVSIINVTTYGIYINPTLTISKPAYIDNCRIWGKEYATSTGIYLANTAPDCVISNTWVMGIQHGVENLSNILIMSNNHIWCGAYSFVDADDWWSGTIGIISAGRTSATNLYIDSPLVAFKGNHTGEIHVCNLVLWFDTSMSGSTHYDASIGYQFDNGRIVIDNGYIRVTDRMKYIFDNTRMITNNVIVILDNGVSISSTNAFVMPILRENNSMYLASLDDTDKYQEIACAYISGFGNFELVINSSYDNITRIVVRKDINNLIVLRYDETSSEDYFYTFSDGIFKLYRYMTDIHTKVDVTLLSCSRGVLVYNYDLIRYANDNNYTRSKQSTTSGLTAIPASQLMRTDWAQYGGSFTIAANSTQNIVIPIYANPQTGYPTGIPSIVVDDANVSLDTYQYDPLNDVVNARARNHSSASVTTPITVFVAFMHNNN